MSHDPVKLAAARAELIASRPPADTQERFYWMIAAVELAAEAITEHAPSRKIAQEGFNLLFNCMAAAFYDKMESIHGDG